jgi:hypothetical protein
MESGLPSRSPRYRLRTNRLVALVLRAATEMDDPQLSELRRLVGQHEKIVLRGSQRGHGG